MPKPAHFESGANLQKIIAQNRRSGRGGTYAVCSAHPWVLEAAIQQALEDGSVLHVESTSAQVNQQGGYTGQTPAQFANYLRSMAKAAGLPPQRILLGADHLGPFPWRKESSVTAMEKACELVRACVLAGYRKLHLDTSMACGEDREPLAEQEIAGRAALLCEVAEQACAKSESLPPLYVIGTEVPPPGGQAREGEAPRVTSPAHMRRTLDSFARAFQRRGLSKAWQRVIGLVVQPGVEFGDDNVFDYDRVKARRLSASVPKRPLLVYEAHSTDYQSPAALHQMVRDHFAILKVGPWLTFAFREAVFALSSIERELLSRKKNGVLSEVRHAIENAMLRDPSYWQPYYQGDAEQQQLARAYSYSDRCRYYWPDAAVQREIARLMDNLSRAPISLPLISQYLPQEHDAIRAGDLEPEPRAIIHSHIRTVLRHYANACGHADLANE
jgi:D-tagatose-1,6-bisphosphate aldolase subunit GatZ/KbaZ